MRRLDPLLPALGITRVANVTHLDYIGIPVCMAVRPASRTLSVWQGKGSSLAAAKVSAIMEAAESFFAEQMRPGVGLSLGEASRQSDHLLPAPLTLRRLDPKAEIRFVAGVDLLTDRAVFVPDELVRVDYGVPRARGYGWFRSSSNGLACGNDRDEALLHAVCELVERAALVRWRQAEPERREACRVAPAHLGDRTAAALLARLAAARMSVRLFDLTFAYGIPCYYCVIDDRNGRPPFLGLFAGSGCHPAPEVALCRALAEAAQSRLTDIAGARDDIVPGDYSLISWERNLASLFVGDDEDDEDRAALAPPAADLVPQNSVAQDLASVLSHLATRRIGPLVAVDLTDPAIGIPCWRVVAGELPAQAKPRP